jgi:hypothetical protein
MNANKLVHWEQSMALARAMTGEDGLQLWKVGPMLNEQLQTEIRGDLWNTVTRLISHIGSRLWKTWTFIKLGKVIISRRFKKFPQLLFCSTTEGYRCHPASQRTLSGGPQIPDAISRNCLGRVPVMHPFLHLVIICKSTTSESPFGGPNGWNSKVQGLDCKMDGRKLQISAPEGLL